MGLMAMLEEVLNGRPAPATVATPATDRPKTLPTVATVATVAGVAVASRPNVIIEKALNGEPVAEAAQAVSRPVRARERGAGRQRSLHDLVGPNLTLAYSRQNEQEAALCADRLQSFQAKGIPTDGAQALANRLIRRDRQLDDRRSCAECVSFHAGRCRQGITPIGESTIQTLHRCKGSAVLRH